VRLGVATGKDLAQACRAYYSRRTSFFLWILAEIAIAACDLAEVLGSAIGLKLLFGIPLIVGVSLTACDVILLLSLQSKGFRYLEALVITLIALIGGCFLAELILAQPQWSEVFAGFVPQSAVVHNPEMLYLAIGILGATVMPHNLYLHSAIIQTRAWDLTAPKKWEAIRFGSLDSTIALCFALFINAAILILAAATFHEAGHHTIASIEDAYQMLTPLLGTGLASTLFAIALLASGQNSTLTGTLAGQIVMEGFVTLRMRPWLRRLLTRSLAIIPALVTIVLLGEGSTTSLLVLSQVILSLQLSFAVIPLVSFTSNTRIMKEFVNPPWLKLLAGAVATLIVGLNSWLLLQTFWGWLH
jgi:manganese transport protein